MQHAQQLMTPSFPPTNIITTEQIQRYLDENKKLILAIMENQNLGNLTECAQYQAVLQKNLMYLAAIADAQPQAQAIPPQMSPHPLVQQGAYLMQHPQAAAMAQQAGIFPPKMPLPSGTPHQAMYPQQLQQQAMQGQMTRPVAPNNNMHPMHANTTLGSSGPSQSPTAGGNVVRSGSNQDATEARATGVDG